MMENKYNSIEKAIMILEILSEQPFELSLQEIVKRTGFNRTTAYRTLMLLKEQGLVLQKQDNDKYAIGHAMYHMGQAYIFNNNYKSEIQGYLAEISHISKESVGIACADGDRIISIYETEIDQPLKMNDYPGKYFPVNRGCYGKTITAFRGEKYWNEYFDKHPQPFEKETPYTLTTKEELIAEYRTIVEQGYCYSIDEAGIDMLGVGIPLRDNQGKNVACLAVSFFRQDDDWRKKLHDLRELLFSYREKIERCLPQNKKL